ncbi:hypothetical protein SAMN05192562_107175 [Kosakonia arachidis]|uniref:Uncharacterized protein n=1 Tax=Kosakonia arachidis TaxID=551989 RepID=A0A1I7DYC4_9ENTR|nr:hypothetical protein [Kosakonia arachidis]SFU16635.1 hypothetical protein SAMN05192562_107175 [Kosakonia arachidis]
MKIDSRTGLLQFNGELSLASFMTKKELMGIDGLLWEPWPDKKAQTVSYRTIFNIKGNKQGDIYLIVSFVRPDDSEATIASWRFAPEKLLMGEQRKPEGKITQNLREWFREKTNQSLPVSGEWGHIDSAYDPHNKTGTIFCHYRANFKSDREWMDYCRRNNVRI